MDISYNANINLLMGGLYVGGQNWTKPASDIDQCYKIYRFREGESIIHSCENKYLLNPGEVYFINGYSVISQECLKHMSVDWLHFIPDSVYLNHLLRTHSCVQAFNAQKLFSFIHVFDKFDDYFNNRLSENIRRIFTIEIQSLIQYMIAQVFKQSAHKKIETDYKMNRLLPVLNYINKNYRSGISLKTLADICCLSPNYFLRLFSETFHMPPIDYIQKRRLEDASRLLIYSNKQIKEIAYETGYEDPAYFSRLFSKIYHQSPRNFRINNRGKLP